MTFLDILHTSDPQRTGWAALALLTWIAVCVRAWYRQRGEANPRQASIVVAYASQTGTAQGLAEATCAQLRNLAGPDLAVKLLPLGGLRRTHLRRCQRLLLVVSTTGQGVAPESGRQFVQRFMSGSQDLSHLKYAMLGLGDRRYQRFCGFADDLDTWLASQGATRTCETLRADRSDPQVVEHWQQNVVLLTDSAAPGSFDPAAP